MGNSARGRVLAAMAGMVWLAVAVCGSRCCGGAGGQVVVDEDGAGGQVVMSNGIIRVGIDKSNGDLRSVRKGDSFELLNSKLKGGFEVNWRNKDQGFFAGIQSVRYHCLRQSEELAEVVFRQTTFELLPFGVEVHYVMRRGDSGFYCFAVLRRNGEEIPADIIAKYPDLLLEQMRFIFWLNPEQFYKCAVSDRRQVVLPTTAELDACDEAKKAVEYYDLGGGLSYSKYEWAVYVKDLEVYGWCSDKLGFWIVPPSSECINGGPTKQVLTIEQVDRPLFSPVTYRLYQSRHFESLTNSMLPFGPREKWAKIYGPTFIYVNEGTPEQQWQDAKQRAAKERAAWPYDWVRHPLYVTERGGVSGKLTLTDGSSAAGAWIVLGQPEPGWQWQGKDYLFYGQADDQGNFAIPKVRPGSYTLYAFVEGVLGEFRQDDIKVQPHEMTQVGELRWTPVTHGRTVWQIGRADRTAAEFRHGLDGLAGRKSHKWIFYRNEFPNDVDYVVGESRDCVDWNYLQPARMQEDGSYKGTTWRIHFDLPDQPAGTATLTIAKSSAYFAHLRVSVNDTFQEEVELLADDAGIRGGNDGSYELKTVQFDAGMLKKGRNTIYLTNTGTEQYSSIMYDCLRLELAQAQPF